MDKGDFVIVTNIEKIKFTGKKFNNKKYFRHTGYPGGIKSTVPSMLLKKKPEEILKLKQNKSKYRKEFEQLLSEDLKSRRFTEGAVVQGIVSVLHTFHFLFLHNQCRQLSRCLPTWQAAVELLFFHFRKDLELQLNLL